jgi:hypothetical protein
MSFTDDDIKKPTQTAQIPNYQWFPAKPQQQAPDLSQKSGSELAQIRFYCQLMENARQGKRKSLAQRIKDKLGK